MADRQNASDYAAFIKDEETDELLPVHPEQFRRSARKRAQADLGQRAAKQSADPPSYQLWSMDELIEQAEERGVRGPWKLTKDELIEALRIS